MKNFIGAVWVLLILSGTACHSGARQDKTDTSANAPRDTSAQHQIQQPPVSADSAGARKTQEKSSVDTMIKKRAY
jgi:hypothetical protein